MWHPTRQAKQKQVLTSPRTIEAQPDKHQMSFDKTKTGPDRSTKAPAKELAGTGKSRRDAYTPRDTSDKIQASPDRSNTKLTSRARPRQETEQFQESPYTLPTRADKLRSRPVQRLTCGSCVGTMISVLGVGGRMVLRSGSCCMGEHSTARPPDGGEVHVIEAGHVRERPRRTVPEE